MSYILRGNKSQKHFKDGLFAHYVNLVGLSSMDHLSVIVYNLYFTMNVSRSWNKTEKLNTRVVP